MSPARLDAGQGHLFDAGTEVLTFDVKWELPENSPSLPLGEMPSAEG